MEECLGEFSGLKIFFLGGGEFLGLIFYGNVGNSGDHKNCQVNPFIVGLVVLMASENPASC